MTSSAQPAAETPRPVHRFSISVRVVHWSTTVLMAICIVTAAILYNGSFANAIGHRRAVELIHVYCGFALPAPMLLGLASRAYRGELTHLNRFTRADWQWLRSRARRTGSIKVGKFNAGQKLFASLAAGSILVLLGTGLVMYFPDLTRLSWRTGATFVHDWFALAVGLLVMGHIYYALRDAEALRGMRTGKVSVDWAIKHQAWADELGLQQPPPEVKP